MDFASDKTIEDEMFMLAAVRLAKQGCGWVNPNPMVGCVIVREGEIIGQGWHHKFGDLHAEREALADCAAREKNPQGATVYVTLEPCCHFGKQPPCTQALIDAGIARVVVGSSDPNPLVAGKGLAQLREAGITVDEGVLNKECMALTKEWRHFISTKRPYVIMKYAMTADGKIDTKSEKSVWLTGAEARNRVHFDRHRFAAILVGSGTLAADNPQLTCRYDGEVGPLGIKQPLRIVLSSSVNINPECELVKSASQDAPVLVIASTNASKNNVERLEAAGVEVVKLPHCTDKSTPSYGRASSSHVATTPSYGRASSSPGVLEARPYERNDSQMGLNSMFLDWDAILDELGNRGIDTLIVEGGPTVHASLLKSGKVDAIQVYMAGVLFGGHDLRGPIGGTVLETINDAVKLQSPEVEVLGNDVLVTWEASTCSLE